VTEDHSTSEDKKSDIGGSGKFRVSIRDLIL
jgi:hypothetical protein